MTIATVNSSNDDLHKLLRDYSAKVKITKPDELALILHTENKGFVVRVVSRSDIEPHHLRYIALAEQKLFNLAQETKFNSYYELKSVQLTQFEKITKKYSYVFSSHSTQKKDLIFLLQRHLLLLNALDDNFTSFVFDSFYTTLQLKNPINRNPYYIQKTVIPLHMGEIRRLVSYGCDPRCKSVLEKINKLNLSSRVELYQLGQSYDVFDHMLSYLPADSRENALTMLSGMPKSNPELYLLALGNKFAQCKDTNTLKSLVMDCVYPVVDVEYLKNNGWKEKYIKAFFSFKPSIHCIKFLGTDLFHLIPNTCNEVSLRYISDKKLRKLIIDHPKIEKFDLQFTTLKLDDVVFNENCKAINLFRNVDVNDFGFYFATKDLAQLEELTLGGTYINFQGYQFPQTLKKLNLSFCNFDVENNLAKAMVGCGKLEELDVSNAPLTLNGVALSKTCKKILCQNNKDITKESFLSAIKDCEALEVVDIRRTNIKHNDIKNAVPIGTRIIFK